MADTITARPTVEKKKRRNRGNRNSAKRVARREAHMAAGRGGFLAREAKREAKRQQEEPNATMIVDKSAILNVPVHVHESNNSTKPSTSSHNLEPPPAPIVMATLRSKTGLPTAQRFNDINLSTPLSCTSEDVYDHAILINTELRSPSVDDTDSHERLSKAIISLLIYPVQTGDYWLNDETITVNLEAINIPSHIKVFGAWWAAAYSRRSTAYTRAFGNSNYTHFIIPFCSGSDDLARWSLIHIRRSEKVVDYYDSLSNNNIIPSAKELVCHIIQKHKSAFPGVYHHNNAICQKQSDGHSCGLFVILNATCLIQNQPIWLQGATPEWIRWKTALHLSQLLSKGGQVFSSYVVNQYFSDNYSWIQSAMEAEQKSNEEEACSSYPIRPSTQLTELEENLDKTSEV